MKLHDGLLTQVAVRVGAPALDLSAHQGVKESHHTRVFLYRLADVVMGQAAATVQHQADVLLMSVEAAGLVLHSALQVAKTLRLLVRTPHLEGRRKSQADVNKGCFKICFVNCDLNTSEWLNKQEPVESGGL